MQMFLEHVLLKHSEVPVTYARRLELVSRQEILKNEQLAYACVKSYSISSFQLSLSSFFLDTVPDEWVRFPQDNST